jgi:hypothetical protein
VTTFDEEFERALPADIRAELEGTHLRPAPPTYRTSTFTPTFTPPPPVTLRPPPPVSAPQPVTPPPIPPYVSKPAQNTPGRTGAGWWLLALVAGIAVLASHLPPKPQPQFQGIPRQSWTETRRALPAVPRALPAGTVVVSADPARAWQAMRLPDGQIVPTCYQGRLESTARLPFEGRFIGEEWVVGSTPWIWALRPGASFASWVDP